MIKTITFAVMHFSVAFGVAYALTGDIVIGGAVAMVEPAVNTVGYHFHEKIWAAIGNPRLPRPTTMERSHGSKPVQADGCEYAV